MNTVQTFLSLPNSGVEQADILILPVPHERTVTYNRGAAKGPQAILDASDQLEFYEEDMGWCPTEHMKLSVLPSVASDENTPEADFRQQLFDTVLPLPREALFIALGGEHSITPEMIFARMPEGGTVVHIDAHADFRPSYHGSIYNHACPMYRIRQKGYELLQIGIRSLHANEAKTLAADDGITTYFDRQLQQPGQWQKLLEQLGRLKGDIWLSIDMDGFDPALIGGVGTPQPGGLSWHQGLDILERLTGNPDIALRGIDIVELIPEPSCVSDMMAAKLVQKCFSYWGKNRGYDKKPAEGSQIGTADE
ncbi:MAG: agmatinase [Candidatus Thiodiazotropha sp. (ex. Lucinisca nassula)]|nr:agmatinase [Candidatus Thiodiazotropha sp. (ex. Lucinisca nassula)]MBW9274835.1 agmatinase [Candidatus Thiodiazotropha sp. (ex. Lucinisca nassula)]